VTTGRSPKKPKPSFSVAFKFGDGAVDKLDLEEFFMQNLRQYARMFASDDPVWRAQGEMRLREAAVVLARAENGRLWGSVTNKANAEKERPAAQVDEGEIESEFRRLLREGHSPSNARGILKLRGRWSQSTIYRRTSKITAR
jgi:hypothetical protein